MGVKSYDLFTCSHVAENISLGIDFHLVKPQASHLFGDTLDVRFLITALAREFYNVPQKFGHVSLITLCSFFDFVKIHDYFSFLEFIILKLLSLTVISAPHDGFVSLRICISFGGEEQDSGLFVQSKMLS